MSWALRTTMSTDELNLSLAQLEAAGLIGISEEHGQATAYFPERVELDVPGEWVEVADTDWNAQARRLLTAVRVGDVVITPPWLPEVPAGTLRVLIDPAQAFGTGHHETTTGCLAALQELDLHERSVIDVGTGSGVLAIAAALLGAGNVVAIDNDPLAVDATHDNAAANGVTLDARLATPDEVEGVFDVVIANLDTQTINTVAGDLAARLAPGGVLVASGVSVERAQEGIAALEGAGLTVWARPGDEWVLFQARHQA